MQRQRNQENAARRRAYVATCREAAVPLEEGLRAWPPDACEGAGLFQGFDAPFAAGRAAARALPGGDALRADLEAAAKRASPDTLEGGAATLRATDVWTGAPGAAVTAAEPWRIKHQCRRWRVSAQPQGSL